MKGVICENCGATNAADNWLCVKCGAKIAQAQDFRDVETPQTKSTEEKTDWDSDGTRTGSGDLSAGDGVFSIVSKAVRKYISGIWFYSGVFWIFSMAAIIAGFIVWMVSSVFPVVGAFAAWLVAPVFVGICFVYVEELKGGQADFAAGFDALKEKYFTAFKATAISEIIIGAIAIPLCAIIAWPLISYVLFSGIIWGAPSAGEDPWGHIMQTFVSSVITAIIIGALARMCFMFTFFVIADEQVGARKAVGASFKFVIHNFLEVFAITLVSGVILVSGAILFGIGILFTIPLFYFIITCYYIARRHHFEI